MPNIAFFSLLMTFLFLFLSSLIEHNDLRDVHATDLYIFLEEKGKDF